MAKIMKETSHTVEFKGEELGRVFSALLGGLHSMAQPLTILQSTLAASLKESTSEAERRRYLEISSDEVERVCGLLRCLQQLVFVTSNVADCESVELRELVASVVEDQQVVLRASGVGLKVSSTGQLRPVFVDSGRTRQALFLTLQIAGAISSAKDVVEISVRVGETAVELMVQNQRARGKPLNASELLSLALAEANIRSQKGVYELVEDPFSVCLTLPVQDIKGV